MDIPHEVEELRPPHAKAVMVAAGEAHSAAIDGAGNVYTWGAGGLGRLGHGDTSDVYLPRKVEGLRQERAIHVSCGTFHTLAISHRGIVFAWGAGLGTGFARRDEENEGGDDEIEDSDTIIPLPRVLMTAGSGVQCAAGVYHSLLVHSDLNVFCWGRAGYGRLGQETHASHARPIILPAVHQVNQHVHLGVPRNACAAAELSQTIRQVAGMKALQDIDKERQEEAEQLVEQQSGEGPACYVAAGGSHTALVTTGGGCFVWGASDEGQTGQGDAIQKDILDPIILEPLRSFHVSKVACGSGHTLALVSTGVVWAWGRGGEGQLGVGSIRDSFIPKQVIFQSSGKVSSVAAGDDFSGAIMQQGMDTLYLWGASDSGKLGTGRATSTGDAVVTPRRVDVGGGVSVKSVSLGMSHAIALTSDGNVYCWGSGGGGKLGLGDKSARYAPTDLILPEDAEGFPLRAKLVGCGKDFSAMVLENGACYIWGKGNFCGGGKEDVSTPKLVEIPVAEIAKGQWAGSSDYVNEDEDLDIVKVDALYTGPSSIFLSLERPRVLVAWGQNESGQTNPYDTRGSFITKPTLVGLPSRVKHLSSGSYHSICVCDSDKVFIWGSTGAGRLGMGKRIAGKRTKKPEEMIAVWELDEDQDNDFTEESASSFKLSIPLMQKILQAEPTEYRETSLAEMERSLARQFRSHLDQILSDDKLRIVKLQQLQSASERMFKWCLPSMSAPRPMKVSKLAKAGTGRGLVDAHGKLFPPELALGFSSLKEIVKVLQLQPLYLSKLAECVKGIKEKIPLCTVIRAIFADGEFKTRIRNTFATLCRVLIRREVESTANTKLLFQSGSFLLRKEKALAANIAALKYDRFLGVSHNTSIAHFCFQTLVAELEGSSLVDALLSASPSSGSIVAALLENTQVTSFDFIDASNILARDEFLEPDFVRPSEGNYSFASAFDLARECIGTRLVKILTTDGVLGPLTQAILNITIRACDSKSVFRSQLNPLLMEEEGFDQPPGGSGLAVLLRLPAVQMILSAAVAPILEQADRFRFKSTASTSLRDPTILIRLRQLGHLVRCIAEPHVGLYGPDIAGLSGGAIRGDDDNRKSLTFARQLSQSVRIPLAMALSAMVQCGLGKSNGSVNEPGSIDPNDDECSAVPELMLDANLTSDLFASHFSSVGNITNSATVEPGNSSVAYHQSYVTVRSDAIVKIANLLKQYDSSILVRPDDYIFTLLKQTAVATSSQSGAHSSDPLSTNPNVVSPAIAETRYPFDASVVSDCESSPTSVNFLINSQFLFDPKNESTNKQKGNSRSSPNKKDQNNFSPPVVFCPQTNLPLPPYLVEPVISSGSNQLQVVQQYPIPDPGDARTVVMNALRSAEVRVKATEWATLVTEFQNLERLAMSASPPDLVSSKKYNQAVHRTEDLRVTKDHTVQEALMWMMAQKQAREDHFTYLSHVAKIEKTVESMRSCRQKALIDTEKSLQNSINFFSSLRHSKNFIDTLKSARYVSSVQKMSAKIEQSSSNISKIVLSGNSADEDVDNVGSSQIAAKNAQAFAATAIFSGPNLRSRGVIVEMTEELIPIVNAISMEFTATSSSELGGWTVHLIMGSNSIGGNQILCSEDWSMDKIAELKRTYAGGEFYYWFGYMPGKQRSKGFVCLDKGATLEMLEMIASGV